MKPQNQQRRWGEVLRQRWKPQVQPPLPAPTPKAMLLLSMFRKIIVSLEFYPVHEFCLATYLFKFAAIRVSKGKEFPPPHAAPPLLVYSTAFLFFLLLPKEIENFITSVRKLNPREQSNSSEHPFPGKEPILEYNFANPLWFSGV